MVKNLWLLRLFLLLAPGILAEILSGNTPIMKLFNPVDLFLLVLAYGVPVSLIWEYKVKYSLSFGSIFLLGLAYGIFNEGLIAKTILDTSSVPKDGFVDMTDHFGINWSWFFMIIPWHAFFSVLLPITLASVVFPEMKQITLYSKKWKIVFLILAFLLLPLMALTWQGTISTVLYLWFYGAIFFLIWFARSYFFQKEILPQSIHGLRWGLLLIVLYLFQFIGAGKMPLFFYILFSLVFLAVFLGKFFRMDEKNHAKFALGAYLSFGFFSTFVSIVAGRIDLIIMYVLLNGGIYLLLRKRGIY